MLLKERKKTKIKQRKNEQKDGNKEKDKPIDESNKSKESKNDKGKETMETSLCSSLMIGLTPLCRCEDPFFTG